MRMVTPRWPACGATEARPSTKCWVAVRAAQSAGGAALFGRAENQDAVGTEIGAKIDQVAYVPPATAAQVCIGRGDVQAPRTHHEPVQADKLQTLGCHDVAVFAALAG